MASACREHAVIINTKTDSVPEKLGSSGVERLPREMNIMKMKDDEAITRFRLFGRKPSVNVSLFSHGK